MPTLSELFNLDPNVERLSLLPRLRGSLPSEKSVMMPDRYMPDVIAPKILYDFIRAIKAPGRAKRGEVLDEEEALNTALNMFGGGRATSGSVPIGALGMSARTAPAGTVPLREIPRSPLGFYSKVEEATLPLQNKGSGGQFLAQIQKTPGVKPEEIEVLGLDTFLQSKPTVTKQEVQDYITANKPDVQETILGGGADIRAKADIDYSEGKLTRDEYNQILKTSGEPAKFGSWTMPGGENYREILLTLPDTKGAKLDARRAEIQAKGLNATDAEKQEWASIMNQLQPETRDVEGLSPFRNRPEFRTRHFSEPNIVAHLRANDRVIDGKKALFIEEIQSDWHQAGRKKGYGPQTETTHEAYYTAPDGSRVSLGFGKTQEEAAAAVDPGWKGVVDVKFDTQTKKISEGVPDAPFKKSWHELALKRAIQEAVDKGYDKLAFTTGKTQVERYPEALRQVADEIVWDTYSGGTRHVMVKKNGATIFGAEVNKNGIIERANQDELIGKNLEEVIGKPMTQRAITEEAGEIKGKDFTVGGKGMEGFYDEILPKALQNLTKKYGTKVTRTKLDARGEDKLSAKLRENGYDPYNAELQQILTDNGGRQPRWLNDTDMTALELGFSPSLKDKSAEVWSMDITPQMREQIASKGQPLFATAPPLGLASQDPLEQFLGYQEAENDPMMQFLGQK